MKRRATALPLVVSLSALAWAGCGKGTADVQVPAQETVEVRSAEAVSLRPAGCSDEPSTEAAPSLADVGEAKISARATDALGSSREAVTAVDPEQPAGCTSDSAAYAASMSVPASDHLANLSDLR